MDSKEEKKAWSIVKRAQSFTHAFRGMYVFVRTTENFLVIHLPIYIILVILGFYFHISSFEWISLVFTIGFMLISEVFNTAFEIDIDLTSPEYHPYARDTKDVAAAAVVLSGFLAVIVSLIIFLPKILIMI